MKKLCLFLFKPLIVGFLAGVGVLFFRPDLAGFTNSPINTLLSTVLKRFDQASYSSAVKTAAPAVVNISTVALETEKNISTSAVKSQQTMNMNSLGSGVIVHPDGFILTNNHVVQNARKVTVALKDGREIGATIIGTDPETDLAVLKIGLKHLPYMNLADSSRAEIGDVVLAIGNPFGLGQTVTIGIVSATGRNNLQLNTYEDFIQTDAAINIGNSGGALINAYGDLIGISTLLYSSGGGSEGIGFAIPANIASFVMESIIKYGYVIRGWLGIESQPLTAALSQAYGITPKAGILVSGVYDEGPADKAGLLRGDILVGINNTGTSDGRQVMNRVAQVTPGQIVTLNVLRNGEIINLETRVSTRPHIVN